MLQSERTDVDDEHWLWGHVNRIKRSIHSLLNTEEHPRHKHIKKRSHARTAHNGDHRSAVNNRNAPKKYRKGHVVPRLNAIPRLKRHYDEDEDNEVGDDDDENEIEIAGSGSHNYEETTDVYSLKPERLCKF